MKAVYPGTFDPMTHGHVDIITRAAMLFPSLIVAVAANPEKRPLFSLSDRVDMIRQATGDLPNVRVEGFEGLLVDFARKHNASVLIKGLRTVSDFEYELQMAQVNREMYPDMETLFIPASLDATFLSSSLIKEIARGGGEVGEWLPEGVKTRLLSKLADSPPRE